MKSEEALRRLVLGTIPTAELVREILRRGGARLYGNAPGKGDFYVRIAQEAFIVMARPARPVPDPEGWSAVMGIAE